MTTATKLFYAQRWKDLAILIMEEWLLKMMEFAEMAKLTCLIREKAIFIQFITDETLYKPKTRKNEY